MFKFALGNFSHSIPLFLFVSLCNTLVFLSFAFLKSASLGTVSLYSLVLVPGARASENNFSSSIFLIDPWQPRCGLAVFISSIIHKQYSWSEFIPCS